MESPAENCECCKTYWCVNDEIKKIFLLPLLLFYCSHCYITTLRIILINYINTSYLNRCLKSSSKKASETR